MARKKGLGKGLGALISSAEDETARHKSAAADQDSAGHSDRLVWLDPTTIQSNPKQPRSVFSEDALQELAESIRRDGVQEPVIVRKQGNHYELVSGERRVRASIMADLDMVPAICRDVSDADMLKLGLIENIQREDLNPIECANAYKQLMDEFGWTQENLADQVGKGRATVANTLRLLHLPEDVKRALGEGAITMGHARALLGFPSPRKQQAACRKVIKQGLSVRQTEKLVSGEQTQKKPKAKDPHLTTVEDELRQKLGTRINVHTRSNKSGTIEIHYYDLDDFERLLDLLRSAGRR